jgi:hypothetical protein
LIPDPDQNVQNEASLGHDPQDDVDLGSPGIVAGREFSDAHVVEVLVVARPQKKGDVNDDGRRESPGVDFMNPFRPKFTDKT